MGLQQHWVRRNSSFGDEEDEEGWDLLPNRKKGNFVIWVFDNSILTDGKSLTEESEQNRTLGVLLNLVPTLGDFYIYLFKILSG